MLETDPNRTVQAPHWKCEYCGVRVYSPSIDLHRQVCDCGKGKGRWGVINGEMLAKPQAHKFDGCQFDTCKFLANESGYCPRHDLTIKTYGLKKVMDEELGPECSLCCERGHDVKLADCPECDRVDVCENCRNMEACCMGIFDEDDEDDDA